MMTPTIHRNGTPASQLQQAYEAAYRALTDAIEAVNAASPNGRDYYPQGAQAFTQAAAEHSRRLAALAAVQEELLALHDACEPGPTLTVSPEAQATLEAIAQQLAGGQKD